MLFLDSEQYITYIEKGSTETNQIHRNDLKSQTQIPSEMYRQENDVGDRSPYLSIGGWRKKNVNK